MELRWRCWPGSGDGCRSTSPAADLQGAAAARAGVVVDRLLYRRSLGGGYAWTENTNTVNTTVFGDFGPGQGYANHSSGFVGGGHLGCNYQVARMVIGIEGSYRRCQRQARLREPLRRRRRRLHQQGHGIATVVGRFGWRSTTGCSTSKAGWAGARATLSVVDNVPVTGAGSDQPLAQRVHARLRRRIRVHAQLDRRLRDQLLSLREQELRDRRRRRLVYVQFAPARCLYVPRSPELQVRLGYRAPTDPRATAARPGKSGSVSGPRSFAAPTQNWRNSQVPGFFIVAHRERTKCGLDKCRGPTQKSSAKVK